MYKVLCGQCVCVWMSDHPGTLADSQLTTPVRVCFYSVPFLAVSSLLPVWPSCDCVGGVCVCTLTTVVMEPQTSDLTKQRLSPSYKTVPLSHISLRCIITGSVMIY